MRQVGVLPSGGAKDSGEPKSLTHVVKAEMFGIRYADEQGQAHTVTVIQIGDQWYMPPNAEQWSKALKPLAPWLGEKLTAAAAAAKDTTPREDTINVLAAEGS